jgi:hypothetical protein
MMNLPPIGPLATAGAPIASTIVVLDVPVVMAAALALGLLAAALCVGALRARRRRKRIGAGSPARVPQAAMPCAALGGGR